MAKGPGKRIVISDNEVGECVLCDHFAKIDGWLLALGNRGSNRALRSVNDGTEVYGVATNEVAQGDSCAGLLVECPKSGEAGGVGAVCVLVGLDYNR